MMATPDVAALQAMKHIVRYLIGRPRLVQRFPRQKPQKEVVGSTDADVAGCMRTRRSTSCATLMFGLHLIKLISATQKVQALASAESEYYSLVRGAAAGIGLVSLARELWLPLAPTVAGRRDRRHRHRTPPWRQQSPSHRDGHALAAAPHHDEDDRSCEDPRLEELGRPWHEALAVCRLAEVRARSGLCLQGGPCRQR